VLIVDDDAPTRELVRGILENEGYSVAEAENGRVALQHLQEETPQLILLDLMMPEMDGFELIVELRKREEWRRIPVAVMTAKDLTSEDRAILNGHVERIMRKGDKSRQELLAEVHSLLALSVKRRYVPS
jgi:CheY-like chemotaxis protein